MSKEAPIFSSWIFSDKGSVMIIGFGLPPLSHEDDPLRAVETALEIHASLQKVILVNSWNECESYLYLVLLV